MDHDTVDSNPKCATASVHSVAKIYKSVINHIFMINKITKNKSPHFFAPPRSLRSGGAKKWGLLFFFKKYKIENNGFITILGSVGNKGMMPTTNFC